MTNLMKNGFISKANAQLVSPKPYHFTALSEVNHVSDAKSAYNLGWSAGIP